MIHNRFELIDPGVVGKLEPAHEATAVGADLEHPAVLKLDEDVLVSESRKGGPEDVGVGGLLPVDSGIHRRCSESEVRENTGK